VLIAWFVLKPSGVEKKTDARLKSVINQDGAGAKVQFDAEGILRPMDANNGPFWQRNALGRMVSRTLEASGTAQTPTNLLIWSLGCGLGLYFIMSLIFPVPALDIALGLAAFCGPFARLKFLYARRISQFEAALPDALDLLARALRSGHALNAAIEVVADQGREPVASEFKQLYQQQTYGLPFRDALEALMKKTPSSDMQFSGTAMLVQKETGGNLAEILDRTVHIMRERAKIRGEVRTKTAQGRLTGLILALLPVGLLLIISFTNPEYARYLTGTPMGHILLYISAGMITIGWLFINKIVNIEI
jgi:tight adherence protein B